MKFNLVIFVLTLFHLVTFTYLDNISEILSPRETDEDSSCVARNLCTILLNYWRIFMLFVNYNPYFGCHNLYIT